MPNLSKKIPPKYDDCNRSVSSDWRKKRFGFVKSVLFENKVVDYVHLRTADIGFFPWTGK
jgi:hypothetical protein